MWAAMVTEIATEAHRTCITNLFTLKSKDVRVATQHSQDGPLLKWLLRWIKGGSDPGAGHEGEQWDSTMGDDDGSVRADNTAERSSRSRSKARREGRRGFKKS